MGESFDLIVLGVGGVGSAALRSAAKRGLRCLGIDRYSPPHDRGSSHGETRIIRQAYFEHPDYVPLLRRAYALWREIEAEAGEKLFRQVGLLQVGPPEGPVISGVLKSAARHELAVDLLDPSEAARRFPWFRIPQGEAAVFEGAAGYLLVERCVAACLDAAQRSAARVLTDTAVRSWSRDGAGFRVVTDRGEHRADRLVLAAGAWADRMLGHLALPLEVRRKQVYWFDAPPATTGAAEPFPAYLFEQPEGVFYGFPPVDGRLKTARHSGGDAVGDPASVDRSLDAGERASVGAFLARTLPGVCGQLRDYSTCLYTMSPDEHFIVDVHPEAPGVAVAAGLSGHGYKFAPVLGEILIDLATEAATAHPIAFLSANRFTKRQA